ncbi:MAG: metallophosphoesterase [Bacilli bacterium]|nr:metallophosphoesterase [Bacilli bacterium]
MTREELNEDKQKEIFQEENREKVKKGMILTFKILFTIIILFLLFFFYNSLIATSSILVKEERIVDAKLPEHFNGLKIIQFSDLHYGSTIDSKKLKEIVQMINKRNPDLVFFTGDLITNKKEIDNEEREKLIEQLKNIHASLGKYAVYGDEDLEENYSTIMNQSEFTILNNEYELIYNRDSDPILLNGFSSSLHQMFDIQKGMSYYSSEGANSDIYSIAIFHEPDMASDILSERPISLLLAGHSHNGYIRFPYLGTPFKVEGAKTYDQAYYKIDDSKLYVSSGLGTEGEGIRIFCRPSINFFRLSNQ